MESAGGANPIGALLGFWMLIQLVLVLGLLLGGIYALFCLNRTAANLDRLASAVEEWVACATPPAVAPPTVMPTAPQQMAPVQSTLSAPSTQAEMREPFSPNLPPQPPQQP